MRSDQADSFLPRHWLCNCQMERLFRQEHYPRASLLHLFLVVTPTSNCPWAKDTCPFRLVITVILRVLGHRLAPRHRNRHRRRKTSPLPLPRVNETLDRTLATTEIDPCRPVGRIWTKNREQSSTPLTHLQQPPLFLQDMSCPAYRPTFCTPSSNFPLLPLE